MAQQVKNPLAMQETQEMKVCSLGQEAPLKEENDIFLPLKPHEQRSLAGYSLWGCKDSDVTEQIMHT